MMILGVIPARGGSKGVKKKNIHMFCGKPLIAWSIAAARQSELLDRFIVSTEDEQIRTIAKGLKAEVLPRPQELASDKSLIIDTLQHVIGVIPADIVVLLQPTSPIRKKGLIDLCINRFLKAKADCLATGFDCKFTEYGKPVSARRQDIKGFFYNDGNVYVIKSELIRNGKLIGKKMEKMQISREQNFEINDELDFFITEQIMKRIIDNHEKDYIR